MVEEKVMIVFNMKAEDTGEVIFNRIAFEVHRETPKMYYRGNVIGGEVEERYADRAIGYKTQFHKSNLPERTNNKGDSTVIEFRIVDVCNLEDSERVIAMHTEELMNKMEQELDKRKRLLDGWVSTIAQ